MAIDYLKKNAKVMFPYILSSAFMAVMFYIVGSLSYNEHLNDGSLQYLLSLGFWVVGFFVVIFLFYTNSFLLKRRKREFGLLNILGMDKIHLARMIGCEYFILYIITIVSGIVFGVLFDKLAYLFIVNLTHGLLNLGFYISWKSLQIMVILFTCIYLVVFLYAIITLHVSNPIELLNSSHVGEKEPKAKWFLTILGIICLGVGYSIGLCVKSPLEAFGLFFVAVLLVIIGTYLLFTSISVFVLKALKKNKHYYYQTKHFISLSSMIYRIKRNAVGLANICILSTMVLVMLSSTICLWQSVDHAIDTLYPREISISYNVDQLDDFSSVESVLDSQDIQYKNVVKYRYLAFSGVDAENGFHIVSPFEQDSLSDVCELYFVSLQDYNAIMHTNETLEEDQVLAYDYEGSMLKLNNHTYSVKKTVKDFLDLKNAKISVVPCSFFVVHDLSDIYDLQKTIYQENASNYSMEYDFDLISGNGKEISTQLDGAFNTGDTWYNIVSREVNKNSYYSMYGGFLFVGVFLSMVFMVATVLIMYYKQINEGYEDQKNFEIMQNVGLDKKMVKKVISSQVLGVFFMPLIVAGVHICFAYPIINKLLSLMFVNNSHLFMKLTILCFLVFSFVYGVIYILTSKVYYRLVAKES